MAEAAGVIIALSQFGGQLAKALYKFGVNASEARKQSNRISERMGDYTLILDILEASLQSKERCFSAEAEEAVKKHCEKSWDLFHEIHDLLPRQKHGWGRDELGWVDKIKWNFRKSRVELLVGELQFVKQDVTLILVMQFLGQKAGTYRKSKRHSSKKQQEQAAEDLRQQSIKANNAVVQHLNAAENLSKLHDEAEKADSLAAGRPPELALTTRTDDALVLLSHQDDIITKFRQALLKIDDPGRRQAMIIERSPMLLHDLLMRWTVSEAEDVEARDAGDPAVDKVPEKSKASWNVAAEAVNFGIRQKKEAEQARKDRSRKQETENEDALPALATNPDAQARERVSAAPNSFNNRRKEMPTFSRAQTIPTQRSSSRKDAAPSKSSNLKHAEIHDSGYGSISSAHTPEMREQSPFRRPELATRSSTRYKIVDPLDSDNDRATTIRVSDDEAARRRYQHSPERPKPPPRSRQGGARERLYSELSDDEKPYRHRTSGRNDDSPEHGFNPDHEAFILDPNEPSAFRRVRAGDDGFIAAKYTEPERRRGRHGP